MVNVGGMYMDPMGYVPIPSAVSEGVKLGCRKNIFAAHYMTGTLLGIQKKISA